jgi:hypothetical protein
MAFDRYHELPDDLSAKTRTFARMIASLVAEAEGSIPPPQFYTKQGATTMAIQQDGVPGIGKA